MDWRLKCLAFHLLNRVPFGHFMHTILQRYVTKRYFQKVTPTSLATPEYHVKHFQTLPPGAVALEFGCGRNLLTPLMLSHAGASKIYAYDLVRLATVKQINDVLAQLRAFVPGEWPPIKSFNDLQVLYRIEYRAPADVRKTGLPEESVDFICSTATLEHIPELDIQAILTECSRIGAPGSKLSFIIDYHDHYGTADLNITLWNFYRYPDEEWIRFNPPNHYQNRLRHCDHVRIFKSCGFDIISDERIIPDWSIRDLPKVAVESRFREYSQQDLLTAHGKFLLEKRALLKERRASTAATAQKVVV